MIGSIKFTRDDLAIDIVTKLFNDMHNRGTQNARRGIASCSEIGAELATSPLGNKIDLSKGRNIAHGGASYFLTLPSLATQQPTSIYNSPAGRFLAASRPPMLLREHRSLDFVHFALKM